MDLQLRGKKAVVTGGTRGIGWSIAQSLAEEGADVAVCARNASQVEGAVERLRARGVRAFGRALDIADGTELRRFVTDAGETLGGIDVLVSNASALVRGARDDDFKAMLEVDVLGAMRCFEAAKPFLERGAAAHGDAAFVIIATAAVADAFTASAYGATKAALVHLARGLARDHAAQRIRVNVVSPGTVFFEGGVWDEVRAKQPAFFETMIERNPTKRMATPDEVAAATVFLASPRSSYTTGANLYVDGALSTRVNY